eukprot:XP_014047430.1 PREDICTED: uncharacterized protein KIAA0754-like [Salmo salar]
MSWEEKHPLIMPKNHHITILLRNLRFPSYNNPQPQNTDSTPRQPQWQQLQTPQRQEPQWTQLQTPQRQEPQWTQLQTPQRQEPQWTQLQTPQRQEPQWPQLQTPQRQEPQWPQLQTPQRQEPQWPQLQTPQRQEPQWPQLQTPQRPEPQWPQLQTPKRPEPQWPQLQTPQRPEPQWPQLQTPQRPEPQWPQLQTPQRPEPQWPQLPEPQCPQQQTPQRPVIQGPQLQTPQRPEPQCPQLQTPQRSEPQWPAVTKTPDQRCQVQVQDTVQCGTPDIAPSQCQTIDCCFNGQQCYYGKAVFVQCTRDAQFVVVVARDATSPKIDIDSISLLGVNDSPCSPVGITLAFAIYQFPVTACGTTLKEESGYVVYENRMASSYNVGMGPRGSITRDSHFELLFQCKYSATAVEALVIELPAGQAKQEVPGRKPDVITRMEHRSLTAVAGRLLLLAAEPLFYRRSFVLARGPWSQGQLVPQNVLEGRQPGVGVMKGILGVLHPGKEPGPLPLLVLAVTPKEHPQLLVHPLHLPVGLRPVPGSEADRDPQLLHEGSPYP